MNITCIHPSRGRQKLAVETAANWYNRADNKDLQYIFSFDSDDVSRYDFMEDVMGAHGYNDKTEIIISQNKNCIEAINKAAKIATGDLFIVISDDFDCPEHWDTLLLEALKDKTDFCAKTIDGHQDWLITLPIMDRIYYERFGYVYNSAYKHCHADLEMTCVAWMLDRYISLPIEFKHLHPTIIHTPLDAINIRNNQSWGQGKVLFNQRLANNFGLSGDLKVLPELPKY